MNDERGYGDDSCILCSGGDGDELVGVWQGEALVSAGELRLKVPICQRCRASGPWVLTVEVTVERPRVVEPVRAVLDRAPWGLIRSVRRLSLVVSWCRAV